MQVVQQRVGVDSTMPFFLLATDTFSALCCIDVSFFFQNTMIHC